jgi:ribonuclease HII
LNVHRKLFFHDMTDSVLYWHCMPLPDFSFERAAILHGHIVCGVDEAGRGPWAGPVVAAAVVLDVSCIPAGLNDSKKLAPAMREALFDPIMSTADVGVGIASAQTIDDINILQATYKAMRDAIAALAAAPTLALVDGNRAPPLSCTVQTVIGGDGKSLSIAAASIIAKVTRDRIMHAFDQTYPAYGFAAHKGYGTARHAAALAVHGPCPLHRVSFSPIRSILSKVR